MTSYMKNSHKFNYPYSEAWENWKLTKTKKDLYLWHVKYTPWFHTAILEKIVESEFLMMEKSLQEDQLNETETKLSMMTIAKDIVADEKKKKQEDQDENEEESKNL